MALLKLQSAMEYLMTYGWAILVIAIIISVAFVAASIFGNPTPNECTALSGFLCSNPVLAHAGGVCSFGACSMLTITVGQNTGYTWTTATVYYVNNLATDPSTGIPLQIEEEPYLVDNVLTSGLASGQEATVDLFAPTASYNFNPGQVTSGQIWAVYTLAKTGAQLYYVEMASTNLKAV